MGRRAKGEAPTVRVDRSSGYGRVIISGKTHWLGPCPGGKPTAEQEAKAARLWYEHLSGVAPQAPARPPAPPAMPAAQSGDVAPETISVAALGLRWLDHCEGYYIGHDGRQTSSVDGARMAMKALFPFGDIAVGAFTPRNLLTVRDALVREGRPRVTCNRIVRTIRRLFKWGSQEGLVPPAVWQALSAVDPLRKGRTEAPELKPVMEVPEHIVEATLPYLPPVVAAMVRIQRWTGARPSEVCGIRPGCIDRTSFGDVWVYVPDHHKNDWRENPEARKIVIGTQAQQVLLPYMLRAPEAFCFSPIESEKKRSQERRAARTSPMTPSQRKRKPKKNGQRRPRDHYTNDSYRRAVHRAIEQANEERQKDGLEPLPRWSPNQLRHLRGGELEEALGIEASNAVLGHAHIRTTEIYAKRKLALAIDATRRLG